MAVSFASPAASSTKACLQEVLEDLRDEPWDTILRLFAWLELD